MERHLPQHLSGITHRKHSISDRGVMWSGGIKSKYASSSEQNVVYIFTPVAIDPLEAWAQKSALLLAS